jgi:hypothetical protein
MNTTEAFFHLIERGFPDLITLEDFQNATNDTTVTSRLLTNAVDTFGNGLKLRMRNHLGRVGVWAIRHPGKYEDLKESDLYMEYLKMHGRKPLSYHALHMPDLMTSKDICMFLEIWGERMSPNTAGKNMRKEHIGLQLKMWDGEAQHRVWALRDVERYRELSGGELYAEYLSKKSSGSTVEHNDILGVKDVDSIIEQYYTDLPDLVTGDQIVDMIEESGLGSLLSSLCVSKSLYKQGATQFRMWDGKRQHRVWVTRNIEKYEVMTGKELYQEWTNPSPPDTEIKDEAIVKALPRLPDIVTPADVRNATGVKLNQVDRLMRNHGTRVKPFEGRTKQFMWIIRNYDKYRGIVGQDLIKEYEKCKKMR